MRTLLVSLLIGVSMMAHAEDELRLKVSVKEPSFVVILPANPTTGYQWSVVGYDKKLLKLSASQYEAPKTKLMGAGGQMLFTFDLQKVKEFPESTSIKFKYARSWESKGAMMKEVEVRFLKGQGAPTVR